ncbi:MAG TPA: SDR family oxidoreductase [Ignavibacteria bacterium]|nr:SDR family oxidoreductase [Ignavibacteria bacterium]
MPSKIIWITGASTGIGKDTALTLSKAGNIIIVTARRKSRLVNIVSEIKFSEREASAFVCDVSSERSIQTTYKRIKERYGKVDVLINNAGVTVFKNFSESKTPDFDYIMDINLRGAFLCSKSVLSDMIKRKSGHIINVLSTAAKTSLEGSSLYSASKAGLMAMSDVLRKETRKFNIKISNVFPGATETPMWDSKTRAKYKNRMMDSVDIANVINTIINQPKKVVIEEIVVRPVKGDL